MLCFGAFKKDLASIIDTGLLNKIFDIATKKALLNNSMIFELRISRFSQSSYLYQIVMKLVIVLVILYYLSHHNNSNYI